MPVSERELARLHWQCRRGMLELDEILRDYLQHHYAMAPETERAAFRALLTQEDPSLQRWLLLGEPPAREFEAIVERLRD